MGGPHGWGFPVSVSLESGEQVTGERVKWVVVVVKLAPVRDETHAPMREERLRSQWQAGLGAGGSVLWLQSAGQCRPRDGP